jgi:phenylpropionate dioxygenase-like ring-hydroxylating dioxygenase large terminal subunit
VQCGYHGMRFDCTGACTFIPGQDNIPPRMKARRYPVVVKDAWIWVWMGEADKADEALLPDYHWNDSPGWQPVGGLINFKANYQLLVDNLLDLTHETYVHQATIGNHAVAETPMDFEIEEDTVRLTRWMMDCPPPPLFKRARGFTGNIDRWQKIWFRPPAHVWIDAGGFPAGTTDMDQALNWMVLNAITPETESTTHYFWSLSRRFSLEDEELSTLLHDQIVATFEEDRDILETQQHLLETEEPGRTWMSANCDAGNVAARQIVEKMLKVENGKLGVAAE